VMQTQKEPPFVFKAGVMTGQIPKKGTKLECWPGKRRKEGNGPKEGKNGGLKKVQDRNKKGIRLVKEKTAGKITNKAGLTPKDHRKGNRQREGDTKRLPAGQGGL